MQYQSICTILGLTTFILTAIIPPVVTQANDSDSNPNQVTFFCHNMFDKASEELIPTTIAWIPERQGNVSVISWKSEFFEKSGWTPEKRCQNVSAKFQNFYQSGQLNYLTTGQVKGNPVICATKVEQACNQEHQLFTLKYGSNPQLVLEQLIGVLTNNTGDEQPLYQSSGGQQYLDVKKLLQTAPLVNLDK